MLVVTIIAIITFVMFWTRNSDVELEDLPMLIMELGLSILVNVAFFVIQDFLVERQMMAAGIKKPAK